MGRVTLLKRRVMRAARDQVAYARYRRARRSAQPETGRAKLLHVAPSPYDRRAQLVTWYSPILGIPKHLHLYLPVDYATSDQRYPVLYLLRGHEREWLNTNEDQSRAGRNVLDVYEVLLRQGQIGPMLLVMPGLTSEDNAVHGFGIDLLKPWLGTQASGIGSGRGESAFVNDLVPFIDAHWRTLPGGRHRGVDGFSMGGGVAAKLAAKFPGLFRTVGAYDGTFFYASDDGTTIRADDSVLAHPIFDPAFGHERDLAHATANSPANLIGQAERNALQAITWMIQYGPERIEPWGSNYYRGEHLRAALARQGIANALPDAVIEDGEHSWRTADRHLAQTLPIHWQQLRS